MAINATDFKFSNTYLSKMGYIIANFDSPSDDGASCGNIEVITARPPLSTKNIIHGVSYGEPIKLTFQILKYDFANCTCSDTPVTDEDYEAIMRWLVRPNYNYIEFGSGENKICFNVVMSVIPKRIGSKICGFEITATNDSVYSYSKEHNDNVLPSTLYNIQDKSSVVGYIYPKLNIKVINDGDVSIEVFGDKKMIISNCVAGEILTVDCEHGIIESSLSNHNLSKDFNFEFIRFCNTYYTRDNSLFIINANVDIKYRFTRMVVV